MSATIGKKIDKAEVSSKLIELNTEITRLKKLIALTPSVTYSTNIKNENSCDFVSDNIVEIMGHEPNDMIGNSTFCV